MDDEVLAAVADPAVEGAEPLEQNRYELELVRGILVRELARMRQG